MNNAIVEAHLANFFQLRPVQKMETILRITRKTVSELTTKAVTLNYLQQQTNYKKTD